VNGPFDSETCAATGAAEAASLFGPIAVAAIRMAPVRLSKFSYLTQTGLPALVGVLVAAPSTALLSVGLGTVLSDGDCVILIKDLPLRGSSGVLKGGSKSKPIRLVDGDHEISCKIDGVALGLKACFVRKA
jgi:protein PhnA